MPLQVKHATPAVKAHFEDIEEKVRVRKVGLDTGTLTQAELDVCLNQWQESHKRAKNSHGFEHLIWEKLEQRKA